MGAGATEEKVNQRKGLSLGNKILNGVAMTSLLGLLSFYLITGDREKKEKNELYQEVKVMANTDKNNITDNQEWANVYESLGLEYDVNYSDPKKDLTSEQMRKYLGKE